MAETDKQSRQVAEMKERVVKAVKFHREVASRGKNPAIVAKMSDLVDWLERQTDPDWWIKNQKACDATVAGINALWREYQVDTFGEWTEREIVVRM
jgi:hypothetical protein